MLFTYTSILANAQADSVIVASSPASPAGHTSSSSIASLEHDHGGYTVEHLAALRRASSLHGELLAKGAHQVDSTLGSVLLFLEPQYRADRRFAELQRVLQQIVPGVFQRVHSQLQALDFPLRLESERYNWQIFLERSRDTGRGMLSSERCHAAWMGPPSNIFLSVDSFLTNCGSGSRSPELMRGELEQVLVHEIAHAIEFRLMGQGFARRQRWHSEGFASWFETLDRSKEAETLLESQGKQLFATAWDPVRFSGSRIDYARSYAMIATIAERKSVADLLAVYEHMSTHGVTFERAVEGRLGWDLTEWNKQVRHWIAERYYGSGAYPG